MKNVRKDVRCHQAAVEMAEEEMMMTMVGMIRIVKAKRTRSRTVETKGNHPPIPNLQMMMEAAPMAAEVALLRRPTLNPLRQQTQ